MILRNHGLLVAGPDVAHAFFYYYSVQRACEVRVLYRAKQDEVGSSLWLLTPSASTNLHVASFKVSTPYTHTTRSSLSPPSFPSPTTDPVRHGAAPGAQHPHPPAHRRRGLGRGHGRRPHGGVRVEDAGGRGQTREADFEGFGVIFGIGSLI